MFVFWCNEAKITVNVPAPWLTSTLIFLELKKMNKCCKQLSLFLNHPCSWSPSWLMSLHTKMYFTAKYNRMFQLVNTKYYTWMGNVTIRKKYVTFIYRYWWLAFFLDLPNIRWKKRMIENPEEMKSFPQPSLS